MHEKLRVLSVTFDTRIEPWELRHLRAAIALKARIEREIFHKHHNKTGGYHHRLPLIRYKHDKGRPHDALPE